MADCEMGERSARGYCPGEGGHAEEICGVHVEAGFFCEVVDGEPVFVESTEQPPVLPHTGADGVLGVFGGVLLVAGFLVLKVGELCFGGAGT